MEIFEIRLDQMWKNFWADSAPNGFLRFMEENDGAFNCSEEAAWGTSIPNQVDHSRPDDDWMHSAQKIRCLGLDLAVDYAIYTG